MPFIKLDTCILTSTLWMDRDAREIFLTALLMAEPFELKEPTKEIQIRSLDNTDFVVPPGWYGFVYAASVGIARMAGIETNVGLDALERLAHPEPESRNPAFDGRRMVRVDGGFIILNFIKFRDRDYSAAQRSKRYRERKKRLEQEQEQKERHAEPSLSRSVTSLSRSVTSRSHVAEAEAEAEGRGERGEGGGGKGGVASKRVVKRKLLDGPQVARCMDQFQKSYPRRNGGQRWPKARQRFDALVRSGVDPKVLVAKAQAYATWCMYNDKIGTELVQQAASFLGEKEGWKEDWAGQISGSEVDRRMEELF